MDQALEGMSPGWCDRRSAGKTSPEDTPDAREQHKDAWLSRIGPPCHRRAGPWGLPTPSPPHPPPPPQLALAIRRRSTAWRLAPWTLSPAPRSVARGPWPHRTPLSTNPAPPRPPGATEGIVLTPQRSPTSGDLRHAPSALPRQDTSTATVRSQSCTGCKDLAWKPPSMPGLIRAPKRRHGLASLGAPGPLTPARSDRPRAQRSTFPQVRAAIAIAPRAIPAASTGRTGPQGNRTQRCRSSDGLPFGRRFPDLGRRQAVWGA